MTGEPFIDVRRRMVDSQLRPNGVTDPRVLAAMAACPRERFVAPHQADSCYRDTLVPIGEGRALSPPIVTARLLDAADVRSGDRVLVVGVGTGYAAALLAAIGAEVVALECDEALVRRARTACGDAAAIEFVTGPLAEGWAALAPYDLIYVDGAVERVPEAIEGQIRQGGRLVGALIDRAVVRLVEGRRAGSALGLMPFAELEAARLPGFAPAPAFSF